MTGLLFVDTSAWFALANRGDPDHRAARGALESFRGRLVTSNFVFDETVTLCLYRLGRDVALRVGDELRVGGVVDLARTTANDEAAVAYFRGRTVAVEPKALEAPKGIDERFRKWREER